MNVVGNGGPARTFLQARVKFLSRISLSFSSWHQVSFAKSILSKFQIKNRFYWFLCWISWNVCFLGFVFFLTSRTLLGRSNFKDKHTKKIGSVFIFLLVSCVTNSTNVFCNYFFVFLCLTLFFYFSILMKQFARKEEMEKWKFS
jgi:cobalamin synthase